MYNIGDYVVNATSGICEIKDIVEMDMTGKKEVKSYFLLVPVGEQTAKVFIPVENADARIRHVIDEATANQIVADIASIDEIVVENEKERELIYKNAIKSCQPNQFVGILKCLCRRRRERMEQGKKCTAVDERYLKIAENHFYSEIAFALGKEKSEISASLSEAIEKSC